MKRGTRVGAAYVAITADGDGINEEIVDSVDAAGDDVEKSGEDHGERYGDRFGEGFRSRMDKWRGKWSRGLRTQMAEEGEKSGNAFANRMDRVFDRVGGKLGTTLGDAIAEKLGDRLEDTMARFLDDFENRIKVSGNRGRGPKRDDDSSRGPTLGATVGGLLGAGSRNNFLNFFGKSIGNIIDLLGSAKNVATGVFKTFMKGFNEAGEGASFFQKTLAGSSGVVSSLGAGLTSLAVGAPAAAAALLVVVGVMSAMASVASALVALLTALASTIVSALTGAVLVLGGAFAAAAAAGGLLTLAFLSMSDAQKKLLSEAFKPLKAELVGLGQLIITDMVPHFQTWSTNLQQALVLLGPLAQVMGNAFGRAGDILTKSLSGPGFQQFFAALRDELPAITRNMSASIGNALNGVMSIFAALMPLVRQFSEWLREVTGDFADWAASAEGQNAIVDFANRAVESLKDLWGFVKELGGFLKDVLFSEEAQESGSRLFKSAKKSLEGFRDDVERFARSGRLEQWFKDAERFAGGLKETIIGLKDVYVALENSGVLTAVGDALKFQGAMLKVVAAVVKPIIDRIGTGIPKAMNAAEIAFDVLAAAVGPFIDVIQSAVGWVGDLISKINSIPSLPSGLSKLGDFAGGVLGSIVPKAMTPDRVSEEPTGKAGVLTSRLLSRSTPGPDTDNTPDGPSIQDLIDLGNAVLNADKGSKSGPSVSSPGVSGNSSGGDGPDKRKKKWKNPYIKWANSLIDDGPEIGQILRRALKVMMKEVDKSLGEAARALDLADARGILTDQVGSLRDAARDGVQQAQDALNSAAEALKGANGPKEAKRLLKEVKAAQRDLELALKNQKKLNAVANLVAAQRIVSNDNVQRLLDGFRVRNATLADYAAARERLALKIENANQKLADAISMRDSYNQQVADSIKNFGALTTAEGKTLDGIQLAVTADDIIGNLQSRLEKVRKFQQNLQVLLAQGLSQDAYKQLVDAGVENGSAYVDALVAGGAGAISQVNGLVGQMGSIADALGLETSNRLYQAGVDAAQGLLDGLESLDAELEAAATKLGDTIANAIAAALGLDGGKKNGGKKNSGGKGRALLSRLGDDLAQGLAEQTDRLSLSPVVRAIATTPAAAAGTKATEVSGNEGRSFVWTGNLVTPTKEPEAVVHEVVNEIVGRL